MLQLPRCKGSQVENLFYNRSVVQSCVRLWGVNSVWLVSATASRVPLNHACSQGDVCADQFAECRLGVCLCTPNYYENRSRCGTFDTTPSTQWRRRSVVEYAGQGQSGQDIKLLQTPRKICFTFHFWHIIRPDDVKLTELSNNNFELVLLYPVGLRFVMFWLIDWLTNRRIIDDYNDMPTEYVISLKYLTYFIVLHCVLAAFCQLLLNVYCICMYCIEWKNVTFRGVKT